MGYITSFLNRAKSLGATNSVSADVVHADLLGIGVAMEHESERLLSECKNILEKEDEELALNLTKLGFGSARNISSVNYTHYEKEKAEATLKYIEYYRGAYPFNKFITQETVDALLKKYDLYQAEAGLFCGTIPTKNQQAIADFRVLGKDRKYNIGWTSRYYQGSPESIERQRAADHKRYLERLQKFEAQAEEMCTGYDLQVLALKDDFIQSGYGHTIHVDKNSRRITLKEGPIVLQPVNGGYLIVTAWGAEANDASMQNEKLN